MCFFPFSFSFCVVRLSFWVIKKEEEKKIRSSLIRFHRLFGVRLTQHQYSIDFIDTRHYTIGRKSENNCYTMYFLLLFTDAMCFINKFQSFAQISTNKWTNKWVRSRHTHTQGEIDHFLCVSVLKISLASKWSLFMCEEKKVFFY